MQDKIKLLAEDCVKVGDKLYFMAKDANFFFTFDLNKEEIDILDSLPEEDTISKRLGAKIVCWNDKLIFVPMTAKKIWIYNLETHTWKGYERKKIGDGKTKDEMFQGVLWKNVLYLIGSNYPAIIRMDLESEKIDYIEEPYVRLKEKREEILDCYFRTDYVQKNNLIYMATCLDNMILVFNMDTLEWNWEVVGNKGNTYSGITYYENNFWLAPRRNSPIVKWNGKTKWKEYSLPAEFELEKFYFLGIIDGGNKIICPGFGDEKTLIIEENKMRIQKGKYTFYKKLNSNLLVRLTDEGKLEIEDLEKHVIKTYWLYVSGKAISSFLKNKWYGVGKKRMDMEDNIYNLNSFLGLLVEDKL